VRLALPAFPKTPFEGSTIRGLLEAGQFAVKELVEIAFMTNVFFEVVSAG
jgi:hypothetical protein